MDSSTFESEEAEMTASDLVAAVGIAVILYVFVTFFMFDIFSLISPVFGCQPIGNGNSIFSTNLSQSSSILSSCPQGSQVYEGLILFIGLIAAFLIVFLGRMDVGFGVVTAGIFLPSILYAINHMGYLKVFNPLIVQIIMIIAVISGVLISWLD